MAEKQSNPMTTAGQIMVYVLMGAGIAAAVAAMNIMGFSGVIPGALFGAIGGGLGGALGYGLAYLTGNVKPKS